MDHLLTIGTLLKFGKILPSCQEPDHCTLHDCGAFCVVVGFQALFHDFARWHVLELEQESPEHGLHCPHAHTNTATLCQFVWWRGRKTKVLTMRRSVHVGLSTCHKVHLSPQISLSCNSISRQLLGKFQHYTRCLSAGLFQELCTVDCSLPLLGGKLVLFLCRAYHVSL